MKIAFTGLEIPEGKIKFKDEILIELEEKFEPKKVSPYFVEFLKDDYDKADAIVIAKESILDLLILDMEKLEGRIERADDEIEKALLAESIAKLEEEIPLCDVEFSDDEYKIISLLAPLSLKPTLVLEDTAKDLNDIIKLTMDKAQVGFFYTAGKPEVHAWFIEKGSDIVTCAGKIHTDLARGFIKGEIVNVKGYREAHNLQDARKKGLTNLVDRDYIIQEGDIVDIRFNV